VPVISSHGSDTLPNAVSALPRFGALGLNATAALILASV
jgi:hypothetical protein